MHIDFDRFLGFTALLAAGTVIGACSSSSSGGGGIACDDAGVCPTGLVCSQGVCVAGNSGGSSGSGGLTSGGGSAGISSGGGPSGGAAGSFGGSGGSPPTGGTGGGGTGGSTSCDSLPGTPAACTADDPSNECQVCVEVYCCSEYSACAQSNPQDNCAWGGPNAEGEITCFQECLFAAGVADSSTQASCAASCVSPGCSTITSITNDLIACLNNSCFAECLQPL